MTGVWCCIPVYNNAGTIADFGGQLWSIGPSVTIPIFEGGQISANIKQQRASYEENVADYRQQVLVAFQDVEDSLSALHYLSQQSEAENRAFDSYKKALDLTNARYTTGLVSYFDVIQAQGLALGAEQLVRCAFEKVDRSVWNGVATNRAVMSRSRLIDVAANFDMRETGFPLESRAVTTRDEEIPSSEGH